MSMTGDIINELTEEAFANAADARRWRAVRNLRLVGMKRGDLEWFASSESWDDKYPSAEDFDRMADAIAGHVPGKQTGVT